MTESELQAIEARAEAATEGPWTVYACPEFRRNHPHLGPCNVRKPDINGIQQLLVWPWDGHVGECCHPFDPNDATFIAHARTDIPALVAEVRRLQRRPFVARMQAALAERVAEVRSLREALREVAAQGHHENCYLMMRHEDAQCSCPWSVATEALR